MTPSGVGGDSTQIEERTTNWGSMTMRRARRSGEGTRSRIGQTGAGKYLVLHYVVVCWLTFHLLSGVSVLSAEPVTVGSVTIRLW